MAKTFLWYVQDETGREVVSWRGETTAAGVTATATDTDVALHWQGDVVNRGVAQLDRELTLYRVDADDKLAPPRRWPVKRD
jgi:hypothetical protein